MSNPSTNESATDKPETLKPPSRWRSFFVITFALITSVGMVIGGRITIGAHAAAGESQSAEPPTTVSVLPLEPIVGFEKRGSHFGLLEPARRVDLAFETGGTLLEVLVQEGDLVSEGQVIAKLDTRTLQANRTAQEASRAALVTDLEQAKLTLARQKKLRDNNFAAGQAYDNARLLVTRSRALIQQADAALTTVDIALDKAELRAPFAARVGTQSIDAGSTVNAGTPIATLLDSSSPVARIGLPTALANDMRLGSQHTIRVADTPYPATVKAIRHDVSARTRTVDVLYTLKTAGLATPAFGQTAELLFRQSVNQSAYRVPVSALTEGKDGLWSVLLTISDQTNPLVSRVAREHVELLHTDGTVAYVQGNLPENPLLIPVGTHRVVVGQRVKEVVAQL